MDKYLYPLGAVLFGFLCLFVVYLYQRKRSQASGPRTWVSYLLIWPLILDVDKSKRDGRFLTKREWLGWAIFAAIAVLAIVITPHRGG